VSITVRSGTLHGVHGIPIEVEVDLLRRLPSITIVGLAASSVKESAERVRSALASSGFDFPRKRVVVNLAPADVRKDGTAFDLPIALGILQADGQLPDAALARWIIVGELALGGEVRPVRGVLSLGLLAQKLGMGLMLPASCAPIASWIPGLQLAPVSSLSDAVAFLHAPRTWVPRTPSLSPPLSGSPDLKDVQGQLVARRALEIAAAGGHHLLLVGPPGCGKSMLARRLPSILPTMTYEEALEMHQIYNAAGVDLNAEAFCRNRPFRAPHHSVSVAGLLGDRSLRPGEISLAHHGVLFLDEAPEFPRASLEVLREPLEEGVIRLTRAAGTVTHPAAFTLVLACNPCPCGRRGTALPCSCPDAAAHRYFHKLSGPLMDRIDLHVPMESVSGAELLRDEGGEASLTVRDRVERARSRQRARGQHEINGRLSEADVQQWCSLDGPGRTMLTRAIHHHHLSARGTSKLLKVARTIADLDGQDVIRLDHLAEALALRAPEGS
jgi:magnesium chelatase family protein